MNTDLMKDRPAGLTEDHLQFLDALRETGVTNMFGARPYLMDEFPDLSRSQAAEYLSFWMKTFSVRHNDAD